MRDPETGLTSAITTQSYDVCKEKWNMILPDPLKDNRCGAIIDSKQRTIWRSNAQSQLPQSVIIDLGEVLEITGFTYLPTQQRYIDGTISHYKFFVSMDGENWGEPVSGGEFSNIRNSPVLQTRMFEPTGGRYIKFLAEIEINEKGFVTIAELGIVTKGE